MATPDATMTAKRTGTHEFLLERWVGDARVSRLYVRDRQMRIGCAQVRMAGIGAVWTDPKCRKQGHMRATMDYLVRFMRDEGFDVSLLFGITDFYPRWGYATMIPEHRLVIPATVRATSKLKVRAFRRGDMPAILGIYNALNALRTGSIVRPPFPEDGFPKGVHWFSKAGLTVVEDEDGAVVGYVAYDTAEARDEDQPRKPIRDRVDVAEVGASDPRAYDAILKHLGVLAARGGAEHITAWVPVDDPFALHCRSYGAEHRVSTRPDGDAMLCIVNLPQFLAKLEPELSRRVAGRGLSGSLRIRTDRGAANLKVSNAGVRVVKRLADPDATFALEQWKLLQLIFGYRTLVDVLSDPREAAFPPGETPARRVEVEPWLATMADALFPQQWAYCSHPDWF